MNLLIKAIKDFIAKNRLQLIIIALVFGLGYILGFQFHRPTVITKTIIQDKIIKVSPEIKIVTKYVDVPVWRDKYITVTNNIDIVIVTENAKDIAKQLYADIKKFESATLNINIEPYIIDNGVPDKELNVSASLYYLSWKMKLINNYKIVKAEKHTEVIIDPLYLGLNYNFWNKSIDLTIQKNIGIIPIIDIPFNVGLCFPVNKL